MAAARPGAVSLVVGWDPTLLLKLTHIGGPTALIELGGWTLLTDPTFDAPGGHYNFGWGTASDKVAGPAIAADDLPPIDAVLLSHDHHEDNLDPAGRELLPTAGAVVTTASGAKRLGGARAGCVAWEGTTARGAGQADARDHRHAVPPRPAAEPPDRRRRDRLHAGLRRAPWSGSPATPCSTTACARSRAGGTSTSRSSTSAACSSRSPARALHDDRRATRSSSSA